MTNDYILRTAMEQSAIDASCSAEDFTVYENKIVISHTSDNARAYLKLPFECNLISYGNNIVASVSNELKDIVFDYISKYNMVHCFETPNLHYFMDKLRPIGYDVCFMAEYFLPDMNVLKVLDCKYEVRILNKVDFKNLYLPDWSNALCEKRKELDMIAVGAYDDEKLVGLAGASADCDTMWQIGVDVLPEYRRCGVASALTSRLALEIIDKGKVPFYCCAWSNIASARNAVKSGFRPSWVEMTVKKSTFIDGMNFII